MRKIITLCMVCVLLFSTVPLYGADWGVKEGIVINIPELQLYLFSGGQVIKKYPIAAGKAATQTPLGKFAVIQMAKNPTWKSPWTGEVIGPGPNNPVGTRWISFLKGYGIHGTNNANSIGTFASHGCVRMHNRDVQELYNKVRIGTPVHIIYETIVDYSDNNKRPYIMIYPDKYAKGSNTLVKLKEKALQLGCGDMTETDFRNLLKQAQYKPVKLERKGPVAMNVAVNGIVLSEQGRLEGNRWLLPLRCVVETLEEEIKWDSERKLALINGLEVNSGLLIDSKMYVPANDISLYCGGSIKIDEFNSIIKFERVKLNLNGEILEVPTYLEGNQPMIQLRPLCEKLGLSIWWDNEAGCAMVGEQAVKGIIRNGHTYVNEKELAKLLDAKILWKQSSGRLDIEVPWYHGDTNNIWLNLPEETPGPDQENEQEDILIHETDRQDNIIGDEISNDTDVQIESEL